ncbi:MAG: glutaredoxin family protein [Pseudomonadota bacterium]
MTLTLTLYSRAGCHLCEEMIEAVLPLIRGRAELEVVDIDSAPELRSLYDLRIPVLAVGNAVLCEGALQPNTVYAYLSDPGIVDDR